MEYKNIQWQDAIAELEKLQEKLVEVYKREGLSKNTFELQDKILKKFCTRALAVKRITTNKGGKTPGIDNVLWTTSEQKMEAIKELKYFLEKPQEYRAKPIRRVWIPKPGKAEKRPLGIPPLIDRTLQMMYLQVMDPIVEEDSDASSYGFRKYRAPRDGIAKLRNLLFQDHGPEWVIDADIEKCFDKMNHEYMLKNIPLKEKSVIHQWLTCGSIDLENGFTPTEVGTPQGSIISPMLCNMTLNGMETEIVKYANQIHKRNLEKVSSKVHLIRYADDILVTAENKQLALKLKDKLNEFLSTKGLNVKDTKTRVTTFTEGVTFLGFDIKRRPYSPQLNKKNKQTKRVVILPHREKERNFLKKVKAEFVPNTPFISIVMKLNPIIQGWSQYYKISSHSVRKMYGIQTKIWQMAMKWAKRRHSRKSIQWIFEKYIKETKKRTKQWYATSDSKDSKQRSLHFLFDPSVGRETKVWFPKGKLNPYTKEGKDYFEKRAYQISISKNDDTLRERLVKRWQGKCALCDRSLFEKWDHQDQAQIEIHHIIPLRKGGTWVQKNLQPLHQECHQSVTRKGGGDARTYRECPLNENTNTFCSG